MKPPRTPYTIMSNGQKYYYCKKCDRHRPEEAFHKSAIAKRHRCCKACFKLQTTPVTEPQKMLRSVRRTVANSDKNLARRWELQDIMNILSRAKDKHDRVLSELTGRPAKKYSIVRRLPDMPFTPTNSLLVTRSEAMGRRHRYNAN